MCFFLPTSCEDDDGGERGLVHCWRGYSYSVVPERMLLPQPVLQVALGVQHGVLLVEGETALGPVARRCFVDGPNKCY